MDWENIRSLLSIFLRRFSLVVETNGGSPHNLQQHILQTCLILIHRFVMIEIFTYTMNMMTPMLHASHHWL